VAPIEPSNVRNRLLLALPPTVLDRLLPSLRRVDMPFRASLFLPAEPIATVYFPESGWVSLLLSLEDGDAAEVGLIGAEGMVGLPLLFGTDQGVTEAMVQSAGIALAMDADSFRRELGEHDAFGDLLLRYAAAFGTQVTMTAACNVRHLLEERLARWLLMSHDRAGGNEFPMTHEFLSTMLGVRRSGVTTAAGALQRAGLIHYEQSRIRVVDRPGLEAAACECHRAVRQEYQRLLGPGALG